MAYQPPPPLPAVGVFRTNTTVTTGFRGRREVGRNHLAVIDDALGKCVDSQTRFRPVSRNAQVAGRWEAGAEIVSMKKRLKELVQLCAAWMQNRGEQMASREVVARRPHVQALGEQAFSWLQYVSFEFEKQDKKVFAARLGGNWNKPGTTGLGAGYAHERTAYTNSGKAAAPSGTALHQRHGELANAGQNLQVAQALPQEIRAGVVADAQAQVDLIGAAPLAVRTAIGKQFSQLTYQDFQALDAWLGGQGLSENVWFMNKTQRMEFMLVVEHGVFHQGFNDPLDMSKYYMYAINEYGCIFCSRPNVQSPVATDTRFNHSSFNAGKDIMCAGELGTVDGHPYINNNSGHYTPTRQQMHDSVLMLEATGLNLNNWYVGVVDPGGGVRYFTAALFKADVNVADNRAVYGPV